MNGLFYHYCCYLFLTVTWTLARHRYQSMARITKGSRGLVRRMYYSSPLNKRISVLGNITLCYVLGNVLPTIKWYIKLLVLVSSHSLPLPFPCERVTDGSLFHTSNCSKRGDALSYITGEKHPTDRCRFVVTSLTSTFYFSPSSDGILYVEKKTLKCVFAE